jgi:hypothetical protein
LRIRIQFRSRGFDDQKLKKKNYSCKSGSTTLAKDLRPSLFSDESVDGGSNPVDGTASTSGSCGDGARAALAEGEKMEEGAENLSSSKDEEEVRQLLDNFCSFTL